jgi:hypothetical protein
VLFVELIEKEEFMHTRLSDQADGGSIHFSANFNPDELRVKSTPFGMVIELADCMTTGEPGGPAFPSRVVRVALPPHTRATGITVKTGELHIIWREPVMIAPVQLPRPGILLGPYKVDKPDERSDQSPEPVDKPDKSTGHIKRSSLRKEVERLAEPIAPPPFVAPRVELYEAAMKIQPAQLVTTELHGMTPVAVVQLNPVMQTEKGAIGLYTEISVDVFYTGIPDLARSDTDVKQRDPLQFVSLLPRTIVSRAQMERNLALTRFQVINPDAVIDVSPYWPLILGDADYLVITDNNQWDETTIEPMAALAGDLVAQFQRLANWKARRGLKSRVVTVTDIVNGRYGSFRAGARDLQEVLRNFLKWAHQNWGVAWLLLGGDINVIPVRRAAGAAEGGIGRAANDPPNENQSFWTGTFLKMHPVSAGIWFGNDVNNRLVRPDNGLFVPYDAAGTSGPTNRGWYFCTSDSYTTQSAAATSFVRVNGPAAEVNADFQWLYQWNTIPTDLYYGALFSLADALPWLFSGRHDWDFNNNGVYGQHNNDTDFDFATYQADVSVGRAPVGSAAQAEAWVNKVISYEQFRRPDGSSLDPDWPRRMVFGADNWGGRIGIGPTTANPPGDNQFVHPSGQPYSLIKFKDVPGDMLWQLIAQVTEPDVRVLPYNRDASAAIRGWHYAVSATNLAPSEVSLHLFGMTFHIPIPTNWAVIYGDAAELMPQIYIFDRDDLDGSVSDQEILRKQIATELPRIDQISRYYSDDLDLPPADAGAAPLQHLTEAALRGALDAGPHFVSLSGHGSWGGCCGLGYATASNNTNGYHTFIGYADSCLTNDFEVDDAVSENLLVNQNGGAVAYIGSTRFSWIGVGDNFQRVFFHYLTTTRHLGLAADSRTGMVNENTGFWRLYNKWVIFSLNLVGDPEMPVWTGPPSHMKIIYAKWLDKRLPFVVKVRHPVLFFDLPLKGAAVSIRQGNFSRIAFTDASGRASFDLNAAQVGDLDITVTNVGFLPFFGKAEIVGPVWVTGQVREIYHQQGNPQQTRVRLKLADNSTPAYYARKSKADYSIILDAVTDAYVTGREISLEVDNHYSGQGVIERFRFWQPAIDVVLHPDVDTMKMVNQPVLKAVQAMAQPVTEAANEMPASDERSVPVIKTNENSHD